MNRPTIFISYNPNSEFEQTLAVRLHTMGAVNNFRMFLPDRYNSDFGIDEETKFRIQQADWFLVFSTGELSQTVKEEIEYAWQIFKNKSKIIVIYNFLEGKTLQGDITHHFTEIYFNPHTEDFDQIINNKIIPKIINETYSEEQELQQKIQNEKQRQAKEQELKQQRSALLALVGIGLGLILLASITD